jgi:multimeric flavodoxin WrbA
LNLQARANASELKRNAFVHLAPSNLLWVSGTVTIAQGEMRKSSLEKWEGRMKEWRCTVCGIILKGEKPPKECPQCSSNSENFVENKKRETLRYDYAKFDVLLINGSSHKSHNTSLMTNFAEDALKKRNVSYRRFNLNEFNIQHCWCCYSMRDNACTYPCRNQNDDMPAFHEMIREVKAVIVCSPINWNNISARLKDFLDRLTSLQNMCLLGKESMTTGKTIGILINGHEDGAAKTMMDIFFYFQQMGFIFAPYGFTYSTHGAENNAETDNEFFKNNETLERDVDGVVNNVIETINIGIEKKLKGKINCVSE